MSSSKIIVPRLVALLILATAWTPTLADVVTDRIERPVQQAITVRQSLQTEEEQWRAEREQLLAKYDTLTQEIAVLQSQKERLTQTADEARQRIATKQRQLADIQQISEGIAPLIEEMIAALKDDIETGPPFLMAERRERVARLEQLAADPEVAVSERFRKAMEAYMVEAEYGNTIEVNQENIAIGDQSMLVNIFRLGRLSLFYETLDGEHCGWFNVAAGTWETLPRDYQEAIHTAIEIGAKRQPVELLTLPLGRMATP